MFEMLCMVNSIIKVKIFLVIPLLHALVFFTIFVQIFKVLIFHG